VLGINGSEFIVLLAVAAVVLGPERLPRYTQQLTQLIRTLRQMASEAQDKVREELGPEFDEVDWKALDPRQYDPRRIVREALTDVVDTNDPLGLKNISPGGPSSNGSSAGAQSAAAAASSASTTERNSAPADSRDEPAFDPDAT
jgi:sec-independent protein translocase protein TatB